MKTDLFHKPKTRLIQRVLLSLFLMSVMPFTGCGGDEEEPVGANDPEAKVEIKALVGSELLILELTKNLKHLNRDAKNLAVPGSFSTNLFAPEIAANSVSRTEFDIDAKSSVETRALHVGNDCPTTERASFRLWPEFFGEVDYFSHAKIYFVSGSFETPKRIRFHAKMGFQAIAKLRDGGWNAAKGKLLVDWVRDPDSDSSARSSWKIAKIDTQQFVERRADELMFSEVLEEKCGENLAERLRFSQHFAYMAELVSTGQLAMEKRYGKYFSPGQTVQHPGVSAVDINNDGWEDLYICDEWVENKLLINDQGRGFYEAAEDYGLNLDLPATSAIFADFDNDGDKDVIIGRCYDRSVLMMNEDGQFVDRTASNIVGSLPFLVTSVAATDFNNDGLIDIYLSTYGYASGNQRFKDWVSDYLTPSDRGRYQDLLQKQHRFLSAFGPSNMLLQNLGNARFAIAAENQFIDHNHNTFQSVWVDYDQDGDQDLYVSNDYAQDFLYRNEGDSFTDVTFEVGGEAMLGFGMGAGWGDYDADGDFDLYVSNMYSKAGSRILDQIPGIDKRFRLTANGNRLYQQEDGKLNCLPGTDDHAAKAGWSWGGQFSDFDNDGLLDIYVGSGYLTSPFDDEQIEDL